MIRFYLLVPLLLFSFGAQAETFQLNDDGSVRDLAAELVWQGRSATARSAPEAMAVCRRAGEKSLYAWRLPRRDEITTLENRLDTIAPAGYWVWSASGEAGVYCLGDGTFFPRQTAPVSMSVRCVAEDPLAAVTSAVDFWAESWQRLDIENYLAAYDEDYVPPSGLNHRVWQSQRRTRLRTAGLIQLRVDPQRVRLLARDRAEVVLIQDYRSKAYRDRVRKRLLLTLKRGRWLIDTEQQLTILPDSSEPYPEEGRLVAGR